MEYEEDGIEGPGMAPECGAIFMSNTATKRECFRRNILAFPYYRANFVKQIRKGTILFLFENEKRELYGVYVASSDGGMNISPQPLVFQGKELSAQVSFARMWDCDPLSESEFQGAIRENYYAHRKFHFGLSNKQVHRLLRLFEAKKLPPKPPRGIVTRTAGKGSRCSVRERLGTEIDEDVFTPIMRSGFLQNPSHRGIKADDSTFDVDYRIGNGEDINYSRGNLLTDQVGIPLHARKKVYDDYADSGGYDSHIPSLAYRNNNHEVLLDKERPSTTYCRSPVTENYENDCNFYKNLPPVVGTNYTKAHSNGNRREDYERTGFESTHRGATDGDMFLRNDTMKTRVNSNGFRRFPDDLEEDFLERPGRAIHNGKLGINGSCAVPPKYCDNLEYEVKGTSQRSRLLVDETMGAEHDMGNGIEFNRFSEKSQNLFDSRQRTNDARRLHSGAPLYEPFGYDSRTHRQVGGDFQFGKNNELGQLDDRQGGGDFPRTVSLSNSLDHSQSFLDAQFLQQKTLQKLKTSNSTYHDSVVMRVIPSGPELSIQTHSRPSRFDGGLSVDTPHLGRDLSLDHFRRKLCGDEALGRFSPSSVEYKDFHLPSHDSTLPFTAQISHGLEPRSSPAVDVSSLRAPSNYGSLPFTESYPFRESPLAPENHMFTEGMQEHDPYQEFKRGYAGNEIVSSYSKLPEFGLEPHLPNEELEYDKWYLPHALTDDGQHLNHEHMYPGTEITRKSVFRRLASRPRAHIQEENENLDPFYMDASADDVMERLNSRQNVPQNNIRKSKPVVGRYDRDETIRIEKRDSPDRAKRRVVAKTEDESKSSLADGVHELTKETREMEFKRRRDLKNGLVEDSANSNISRKEEIFPQEPAESEIPVNKQQKRRKLVRPNFGSDASANPTGGGDLLS